jgi:hypothetical protein
LDVWEAIKPAVLAQFEIEHKQLSSKLLMEHWEHCKQRSNSARASVAHRYAKGDKHGVRPVSNRPTDIDISEDSNVN